jgi:hypothetical protein
MAFTTRDVIIFPIGVSVPFPLKVTVAGMADFLLIVFTRDSKCHAIKMGWSDCPFCATYGCLIAYVCAFQQESEIES